MLNKFLFALVFTLFLAWPVAAQNGDAPPATAAEGLQVLAAGLAALAGLLAYAVTDAFKRIPWLTEGEKSKISGPMANLVAAVVSVGSGYLVGYLGQVAGFLDESGLWQVVLFAWPAAKAWFEVSARRSYVELQPVVEEINYDGPDTR